MAVAPFATAPCATAQRAQAYSSMLLKPVPGPVRPRPFVKAVPGTSAATRRRGPVLRAAVAQPLLQQEVVYEGRVDAVPEDEVPAGMFRSLDATEDLVQRLQNQCALLETLTKDAQGMRDKTAFFTSPSDNAIMKQHIHRTREQRKQDRLNRRAANLAQSHLTVEEPQQQQQQQQAPADSLRLQLEQVFSRTTEAASLEATPDQQQQQQTLSMEQRRALRQQRKATRTQQPEAVESSKPSITTPSAAAGGPAAPSSSSSSSLQQQADVQPPRRMARTAPARAPTSAAAAAAAATLSALEAPASPRAAPAAASSSAAARAPAAAAAAASAATSASAITLAPASTALGWGASAASSSGSGAALPARQSMARERAARRSGRHKVGATSSAAPAAAAAGSTARGLEGFGTAASVILESASSTPILAKDEVNDLCRMVQDLLGLEELGRQLAEQMGREPTTEEWAAAAGMSDTYRFQLRVQQGQRAKQMMVSSNLRLVASICRSFADTPGVVMQDLIAEGIAGLMRGVERFEPERGFKFSTYAHWWIRQSVNKVITEQGRAVRLPQHLHEGVTKMQRAFAILCKDLGRKPTTAEVAASLDWTVDKIQDLWELMKDPSSLEQPSFDEPGAGTLGDTIEDERMLTAEDQAVVENMKSDLEQVLLQLNPREAGVVRLRFGLKDGHERTLEDVGAVFGVTRERVRQIEARALRLLRAHQAALSGMQEYSEDKKKNASRNSKGTNKTK